MPTSYVLGRLCQSLNPAPCGPQATHSSQSSQIEQIRWFIVTSMSAALKYKPFRIILPTAASVGSGSGLTPHITVGWSRHANQWHAACSRRTHIDDSHPQNADFAWTPYVCRGSHDGSFRPVRRV